MEKGKNGTRFERTIKWLKKISEEWFMKLENNSLFYLNTRCLERWKREWKMGKIVSRVTMCIEKKKNKTKREKLLKKSRYTYLCTRVHYLHTHICRSPFETFYYAIQIDSGNENTLAIITISIANTLLRYQRHRWFTPCLQRKRPSTIFTAFIRGADQLCMRGH